MILEAVLAKSSSILYNEYTFMLFYLQDLYYSDRTHVNSEEIRLTYCLHALNHILKLVH